MKKASLFDIRTIIGALLGIYGVILFLASFTTSDAQKARVDGINANLWVGLSLLVVGGFMIAWAIKRPIVIDEEQLEADKRAVEEAAGRRTDDDTEAGEPVARSRTGHTENVTRTTR